MSRMVSRARIAQAAAILLGLIVLGMLVLTVVLDSLTHYPGTGGPLVDSLGHDYVQRSGGRTHGALTSATVDT